MNLAALADFVTSATIEHLPDTDRMLARRHFGDAAVAFFAGVNTHEGRAVARLADGSHLAETIAAATAIIRTTEVDDIHLGSCTTPSSVAVPLAVLLAQGGEPARVETAAWIATEFIVRFGIAMNGPKILYRGIWPTAFAATVGAAAAAAHVWSLDSAQTTHALSLALMMAAGRTGRFQGAPTGRWVVIMGAVTDGLRAARAARRGFKGDPGLLEGGWMNDAQGVPLDVAVLTKGLGPTSVYPKLSLKPFSTARQALAATDGLLALLDEGLDPDTIEAIEVRVPSAYAGMIAQAIDPKARASGYVSVRFQMAIAALCRDALWDLDRTDVMADVRLHAFAERVYVTADEGLQALYPAAWPAEIIVSGAGRTWTRRVVHPRGDPQTPLSVAALGDKAQRLLHLAYGGETARTLLTTVDGAFASSQGMNALHEAMLGAMRDSAA